MGHDGIDAVEAPLEMGSMERPDMAERPEFLNDHDVRGCIHGLFDLRGDGEGGRSQKGCGPLRRPRGLKETCFGAAPREMRRAEA